MLENIFSYITETKELELLKYNNKLKKILKIDKYKYQKLFVQNHFMVDLSKFKISNLIKFFKSNYNNFSGKEDENNLKKIISEIPQFNECKKEKLVIKNDDNYKKILKEEELKKFIDSNNNHLLSNLKILNIQIHYNNDVILIKDVFPNLVKLKIKDHPGIIHLSYNLLKRIQILSLINSIIEIDAKNKEIELLSLKSLKIKGYKNQECLDEIKITCPNLEYLFLSGCIIYKFFSYDIFEKLNEITLAFPKLIYCNIFSYSYPKNNVVPKGLANNCKKEITIKRFGQDLFKYETNNFFHEHDERHSIKYKDLNIKTFYYSNENNLKKQLSQNYEEIIENANGYKGELFKIIKSKNDSLKYLQYIGIIINKDNTNGIHILAKNLKNFLFLRSFYLEVEDDATINKKINKKDLLDIIKNLSKLSLIENIKIEASVDLNEKEEKNILSCIEGIEINKKGKKILIELNSEFFNKGKNPLFYSRERFQRIKQ